MTSAAAATLAFTLVQQQAGGASRNTLERAPCLAAIFTCGFLGSARPDWMGLLGCTNQGLTFPWSFLFFSTLGNEGYGAIQWQGWEGKGGRGVETEPNCTAYLLRSKK